MKSKKMWTAVLLAGLFLPLPAQAREKKSEEPFYRRYLIVGNPLDDRIRAQEKRIASDPDSAPLHNDLGNLLAARRFPREAREQYETAMKLDKTNFLAPYNMGIVLETEGRAGAAISAYEKSIDRNRGFPPARFRLGRLYERRGSTAAAVEQYARAFQIDPSMRDVRRNPLVAETRLLDRVSLQNYEKDVARASFATQAVYADEARFRKVPTDRPVWTSEVVDTLEPEPVDGPRATSPRAPATMPAAPGQVRPQELGGRPAPPPSGAGPAQPENAPASLPAGPTTSPGTLNPAPPAGPPPDAPQDNPLGLRPRPPLPTPLPQGGR
ncbi:MAG: tetratricopeptide repeat protein [Acidobacteria bacterium]|nr:tetratricopeptide repeat protein [Acidobacteriota bacterium]